MSLIKKQQKKSSPVGAKQAEVPAISLPETSRTRLWELFGLIEKEFETVHSENTALREKVDQLTERLETLERSSIAATEPHTHPSHLGMTTAISTPTVLTANELATPVKTESATPLRKIKSSGTTITKKLMPGKKSASFVKHTTPECSYVCSYHGHKDGVWHVAHAKHGESMIGTASADGTAIIWDVNNGAQLLKYIGHAGSVNCISFHPKEPLACTASGDGTAHIWRCSGSSIDSRHYDSSGEEREEENIPMTDNLMGHSIKVPIASLQDHTGPVIGCDWMCDGDQLVTGSWDHSAILWDAHTGAVIHSLTGHDEEIVHISTHQTQKLVVTSSRDTTFRLWDFRAPPIHSVNVFQGHSKAVSAAVFSTTDNVISAADDHTIKIWDLHNMRYPYASIRTDCGINRISVSHDHILAVPLDNRLVRLYDLGGNRLANLPQRNRKGHLRMVHCVSWSHDSHVTSSSPSRCNLFSAGFDSKVLGWKVTCPQ